MQKANFCAPSKSDLRSFGALKRCLCKEYEYQMERQNSNVRNEIIQSKMSFSRREKEEAAKLFHRTSSATGIIIWQKFWKKVEK